MEIKARNYHLRKESGSWLGQVVLTTDGAFMSITDYGNFCFAWRSTGVEDFRKFIVTLDEQYFTNKMVQGIGFIAYGKNAHASAEMFAKKILPALKVAIMEELESELIQSKEALL